MMLLIWLDHIAGPQSWRWLSPEEINHLQSLLFSGAISAIATFRRKNRSADAPG
jgi:hypothetical protein